MILGKLYDKYQQDYAGLSEKQKKKQRLIDFEDEWLDILLIYFNIEYPNENTYLIKSRTTNKNLYTYYPGKDKIQIHKNNRWREKGIIFLLNNLDY